jgi:hypothetical protein
MSDDGATGSNGGNFACSFLQVVGLSVQACHAAVWYPFIFFWIFLEITLDDWLVLESLYFLLVVTIELAIRIRQSTK